MCVSSNKFEQENRVDRSAISDNDFYTAGHLINSVKSLPLLSHKAVKPIYTDEDLMTFNVFIFNTLILSYNFYFLQQKIYNEMYDCIIDYKCVHMKLALVL